MPKDYYLILGIPHNSSPEDIKAAYRRLVKEYHPDHYGKDKGPFLIIQEAYAVLGNPVKRDYYDKSLYSEEALERGRQKHYQFQSSEVDIEPLIPNKGQGYHSKDSPGGTFHTNWSAFENVLEDMLTGFGEQKEQFASPQEQSIEINLTNDQAQLGGIVQLDIPLEVPCTSCYHRNYPGQSCWRCAGRGQLLVEKNVLVSYPAGISNNHMITLTIDHYHSEPRRFRVLFKVR